MLGSAGTRFKAKVRTAPVPHARFSPNSHTTGHTTGASPPGAAIRLKFSPRCSWRGPVLAAAAPLGRSFTYQGPFGQAGAPVEGTVSLRFSLWDAAGSGDPPSRGIITGGVHVVANAPLSSGVRSPRLATDRGQGLHRVIALRERVPCSSPRSLGPPRASNASPGAGRRRRAGRRQAARARPGRRA